MNIVRKIEDLREMRAGLKNPVGFVPTMGYLHEGHLSLVRHAKMDCENVVVSIFVNPTQFGPSEDLTHYPKDLDRDLDLLVKEGVDLVWNPSEEEMYPPDFQTWVTVDEITKGLEGKQRPGHFRGVTTIVAKLLNAVQPQKAYFGQKDAQQAIVIKRMVHDLNMPVEIIICPTVRETDGLAMSSRNSYLNAEEREAATILYRALNEARKTFENGEHDAGALRGRMSSILDGEPLVQTQYVSVADSETLQELEGPITKALLSMAVYVGRTRLIDNVVIGERESGARNREWVDDKY